MKYQIQKFVCFVIYSNFPNEIAKFDLCRHTFSKYSHRKSEIYLGTLFYPKMKFNISANENLSHLLNKRLFNNNDNLPFDVKIKVNYVKVFKAHSIILSIRSIHFR